MPQHAHVHTGTPNKPTVESQGQLKSLYDTKTIR